MYAHELTPFCALQKTLALLASPNLISVSGPEPQPQMGYNAMVLSMPVFVAAASFNENWNQPTLPPNSSCPQQLCYLNTTQQKFWVRAQPCSNTALQQHSPGAGRRACSASAPLLPGPGVSWRCP